MKNKRKYITSVSSSSKSLNITNEILDFSTIEAGKFQLDKMFFSLNEVLESTLNMVHIQAEEKGLRLVLEGDLPPFTLHGYPVLLGQVLLNLCTNAIKFTDIGRVCLKTSWTTENSKCTVLFVVKDTGIGIETEFQKSLSQAFSQADVSTTRKYGSTGLGLAISARLVSLMGSEIKGESSLGKGSSFSFAVTFGVGTEISVAGQREATEECSTSLSNKRILLVEDNEFNQLLAIELLKQQQVVVSVASNGEEAISKIREDRYDLILMDIQMPVCDGLTAVQRIRQMDDPYYKNVPIIAMTANVLKGDRQKSIYAGMNGYIAKPFEPNDFYGEICRLLPVMKNRPSNPDYLVLDTVIGINRLLGNREMYDRILTNFKTEFENTVLTLQHSWLHNDQDTILRDIHTLKGASGAIGAMRVHELSTDLEAVLKAEEKILSVSDFDALGTAMNALFVEITEQVTTPVLDNECRPLQDLLILHKLLTRFNPFLRQGKVGPSIELMRELTVSSWPVTVRTEVANLVKSIDDYNFKKAGQITDLLLKIIEDEGQYERT